MFAFALSRFRTFAFYNFPGAAYTIFRGMIQNTVVIKNDNKLTNISGCRCDLTRQLLATLKSMAIIAETLQDEQLLVVYKYTVCLHSDLEEYLFHLISF